MAVFIFYILPGILCFPFAVAWFFAERFDHVSWYSFKQSCTLRELVLGIFVSAIPIVNIVLLFMSLSCFTIKAITIFCAWLGDIRIFPSNQAINLKKGRYE